MHSLWYGRLLCGIGGEVWVLQQEKWETWAIWGREGCKNHHCVLSNIGAESGFYHNGRYDNDYSRGVDGTIAHGRASAKS